MEPVDKYTVKASLSSPYPPLLASFAAMRGAAGQGAANGAAGRTLDAAQVTAHRAFRAIGQQAIQLHGGMGMTEELKVSHTFRRLTMIAQQFGDAEHHLDRFARTS